MISEERLLKVLRIPHLSEKTSTLLQKHNTIVFQVDKDATKLEIKTAVYKLLEVKVNSVHTMLIKGKKKRIKQRMIHHRNWKKAYITLQAGQKIDFLTDTE